MGCGRSREGINGQPLPTSPFQTLTARTVPDVVHTALTNVPGLVHVQGIVAHAGTILRAPFDGQECLLCAVSVRQTKGDTATVRLQAASMVEFRVVGEFYGTLREVFVQQGLWDVFLQKTCELPDVRLDGERDTLVDRRPEKVSDLPWAKTFWDFHGTGSCTTMDLPGRYEPAGPRGTFAVEEFVLTEGQAVAVVGRAKVAGGRVLMTAGGADGMAVITNRSEMAPGLSRCPPAVWEKTRPKVAAFRRDKE